MPDLKTLRRRIVWPIAATAVSVLIGIVSRLPLAVGHALTNTLAWIMWQIPSIRRLIMANLRVAFPDWDDARRRTTGRASLRKLLRGAQECVWYLRHPDQIKQRVAFPDAALQQLQRLKAKGKGVIILTPHLGYWELGNFAMNAYGEPVVAIMRQNSNPAVDRLLRRAREAFGAEMIHERGAAKALQKRLKDGQTIAMLVDQNTKPSHGGMFVTFFGVPSTMSRAPALFARRYGVPVAVGACLPGPDGRLEMRAALVSEDASLYASDEAFGQAVNDATEGLVRQAPDQYLWLYQKWRYLPPGFSGDRSLFPYYAKPYVDHRAVERERRRAAQAQGGAYDPTAPLVPDADSDADPDRDD